MHLALAYFLTTFAVFAGFPPGLLISMVKIVGVRKFGEPFPTFTTIPNVKLKIQAIYVFYAIYVT